MRHAKVALPEPLRKLVRVPTWIGDQFHIEVIQGMAVVTGMGYECAIDDLTPDEARAFGAALIAASYEIESSTSTAKGSE